MGGTVADVFSGGATAAADAASSGDPGAAVSNIMSSGVAPAVADATGITTDAAGNLITGGITSGINNVASGQVGPWLSDQTIAVTNPSQYLQNVYNSPVSTLDPFTVGTLQGPVQAVDQYVPYGAQINDIAATTVGGMFGGPLGAAAGASGMSALQGANALQAGETGALAGAASGASSVLGNLASAGSTGAGGASAPALSALPSASSDMSGAVIDPTQVAADMSLQPYSAPSAFDMAFGPSSAAGSGFGDAGNVAGSASGTAAGGVAGDTSGTLLSTVTSPNYTGADAVPGSTVDTGSALSTQQQVANYLGTTPGQVSYSSGGAGAQGAPVSQVPTLTTDASGNLAIGGGAGAQGAPAAVGGGGTAPFGSIKNFIANPSLGSAANIIGSNPGLALSALGMGYSALKGNQQPKGYNQVNSIAQQMGAQGAQLSNAALNNALPAGAQAQLNQAANAAKASIRSQYAQMGLSGSTMETQALANVDQQIAAQGFNMVQSLYQQGVNESGMAANLYNNIMQVNAQQNEALSGAISNFAGALGGSSLGGGQPRAAGYYGG